MASPSSTLYPGPDVYPGTEEPTSGPMPIVAGTAITTEAPRMSVSLYRSDYTARLGQVPDYISCEVSWQYLGVGSGELVVAEDDPIAPYLLAVDSDVLPIVVTVGDNRWSGRVAHVALERSGPPGSGTITVTLVDDWIWLQRMLASQNGGLSSVTGMGEFDVRSGPAATVAARYINSAATRLGVPVCSSAPPVDSSPSVRLKARMTPLADLLTDPLKDAGVSLTAQIWLTTDPQPPDLLVALPDLITGLTSPTVVFRPQVLADKPWLQWSDTMANVGKMNFEGTQPSAYRAIIGLDGTGAARNYDQVINATRRTDVGPFGLPEIYVDATDSTLGVESAAAGVLGLANTRGRAAASFEVADADPFVFGKDYVVGDIATLKVGGLTWRQRISKVTARDDRADGLVLIPAFGDEAPDVTGNEMMVRALTGLAEQVRTLQAGR